MGLTAATSKDRSRPAFACLGAAAIVVYFVLPGDSTAASALYQGFSFVALVLLSVRAAQTRGRERLGWVCFAAGVLCFFLGDAIWMGYQLLSSHDVPFPSIADPLYLAGYPFFVLGTFFAFSGKEGRSLGSFLEASIVTCASGLLIWLIVVEPIGHAHGAPLLERLTGAAYPTMDFLLLGALSQSVFRGRRRGGLLTMVAAALMLQTAADLVYARLSLSGLYTSGSWVDAGWLLTYLLWGVAALTREPQEPAKPRPVRAGLSRLPLGLMFLALLAPPLTLIVETESGRPLELEAVLPAWLVIAVLVFARLVLLIRELLATQGVRHEQTEALRVQNALLEASERERARLLARTSEVAEQERMRIATELHDGPIQKLTVVAFKLDRLERRIARDQDGVEPLIREIRDQLQTEMSSLRRVMSELRPPILDERNLAAALNDCAEQVFADASIEYKTICDLGAEQPAPEVETAVYRVVREALIKVRRQATATRVDVEVAREGESLHLLITDDGGGFDDSSLGMEERIAGVGGIFAIGTVGTRTRIEATLPWKPRVTASVVVPSLN